MHEQFVRSLPDTDRRLHVFTYVGPDGEKETIAIDGASGEILDLADAEADEARALRSRCGTLDRRLCDVLGNGASAAKRLPVMIWLLHEDSEVDRSLAETDPAAFEQELDQKARQRREVAERVGARLDAAIGRAALTRSKYAPVLAGRLNEAEVTAVASDPEVGLVMLSDDRITEDLANSKSLAGWSSAPDWDGTNVDVGVLELARPDDESELPPLTIRDSSGATSAHARAVAGMIRNTTSEPGFANDASIFIANRKLTDDAIADIDWARNQGTRIHNQSWHFDSEHEFSSLSARDMYLDYMTRQYVLFYATAAGDREEIPATGDPYYVVHKGYNIVTVGGTYSDGSIVDGSSSGDCGLSSDYVSTWTNAGGSQELPHLVADGACIDAVSLSDWSGTSLAAPAVAGMAAGLREYSTGLTWPEPMKAVLLASPVLPAAQSPDGCEWRYRRDGSGDCTLNDGRDGTGLVNGERARKMAATRSTGPEQFAHDQGSPSKADFDSSSHLLDTTHYAWGPQDCDPFGYRLRVALAWDSDVDCDTGNPSSCSDDLEMDLDLLVYEEPGSTLVAQSATTTNSYEHVDVAIRPRLSHCSPSGEDWGRDDLACRDGRCARP